MKTKSIVALMLAMLMLFSGCDLINDIVSGFSGSGNGSGEGYEYEDEAAQLKSGAKYYNEYLGVELSIPAGWWLYDISAENMATEKGLTTSATSLDISKNGDYALIYLINFANLQYSNKDNHLGFTVYAENDPYATNFDEYVEGYLSYMLSPFEDGSAYTLLNSYSKTIGGVFYEAMVFNVPQEGSDYSLIGLVCQLGNGYYLAIEVDFWPDNSNAEKDIISVIEDNFTVTVSGQNT